MAEETSPLAPGPLPLIGADFRIVGAIGRIGDGLVYVARDGLRQARLREYCPRGVARRVPDGTLHSVDARLAAAWTEASGRFLQLGHKLASIDHFGVAPVWRAMAIEADGLRQGAYQIGAPVGEPLSAALRAGLQLTPPQVLRIAQDLSDALAALHARGLAHLDIAPDTVSIAGGHVELTDFAVDNRPFMALLETQEGLVRPGYSPIEHHDASMAEPLGPPADVYGASALLFRLVTGRDPAPWQERWRDPSASRLADRDAYPPAFLEAIRKGLAIEPEARFGDAGAWRSALGLPEPDPLSTDRRGGLDSLLGAAPLPVVPMAAPIAAVPLAAAPDDMVVQAARRRGGWLVPTLLALALLVIALGGYLAYQQSWFFPGEATDDGGAVATRVPPRARRQPEREPSPPEIRPGATISGQLGGRDRRRPGGQFEDLFVLRGAAGERIEIRLSSADFDPLLSVTGPGFSAASDDDAERGTRDSRLAVTLPRGGAYTISASSSRGGAAGGYLLEIEAARPAISIATPAMLAGRWRRAADPVCDKPVVITIEGDELVYTFEGGDSREQILDGVGRAIRTRTVEGDEEDGTERQYDLSEDGDSFAQDGGIWVRC